MSCSTEVFVPAIFMGQLSPVARLSCRQLQSCTGKVKKKSPEKTCMTSEGISHSISGKKGEML